MTRRYTANDLKALSGDLAAPLGTPAKRRKNLESEMQRALIRWWRGYCQTVGVPEILLFSIPNGGGGGEKRGYWLKLEGQRKGAPDLFLAVSRSWRPSKTECTSASDTHGLFLELKTPTGQVSPEQEVYHGALRASGYRVEVCRSLESAKSTVIEYLK